MTRQEKVSKRALKVVFYGAAAAVGVLLAVSAIRKRGDVIKEEGEKMIKKTKNKIKSSRDNLNRRQKQIIDLFDREEKITNEMISSEISNVSRRTLRRDLSVLEEKGYIRQVGKTKGSYYILN